MASYVKSLNKSAGSLPASFCDKCGQRIATTPAGRTYNVVGVGNAEAWHPGTDHAVTCLKNLHAIYSDLAERSGKLQRAIDLSDRMVAALQARGDEDQAAEVRAERINYSLDLASVDREMAHYARLMG